MRFGRTLPMVRFMHRAMCTKCTALKCTNGSMQFETWLMFNPWLSTVSNVYWSPFLNQRSAQIVGTLQDDFPLFILNLY